MAVFMSRSFASLCAWFIFDNVLAQAVSSRALGAKCDFKVYYNRWLPTFSPDAYRPFGPSSGVQCLEACCRDPACDGLALESSFESQCYKYAAAPDIVDEAPTPLLDFLEGERVSQWSVFVKTVHPPAGKTASSPMAAVLSAELWKAIAARPRPVRSMVSEESALDRKLRGVDPTHNLFATDCEWTVFYDRWVPTFVHGEYTHDKVADGTNAHCLQKCCEDPLCKGLSLESSELDQCYKYDQVPRDLDFGEGKRLGNGRWLRQKPKKWSVFVKATHPSPTQTQSVENTATQFANTGNATLAHLSATENADADFVKSWLSDGRGSKLRWIALVVVLATMLAMLADNVFGRNRVRTVFELKVRPQRGPERSPLLADTSSSREPGFGAAVYANTD